MKVTNRNREQHRDCEVSPTTISSMWAQDAHHIGGFYLLLYFLHASLRGARRATKQSREQEEWIASSPYGLLAKKGVKAVHGATH